MGQMNNGELLVAQPPLTFLSFGSSCLRAGSRQHDWAQVEVSLYQTVAAMTQCDLLETPLSPMVLAI